MHTRAHAKHAHRPTGGPRNRAAADLGAGSAPPRPPLDAGPPAAAAATATSNAMADTQGIPSSAAAATVHAASAPIPGSSAHAHRKRAPASGNAASHVIAAAAVATPSRAGAALVAEGRRCPVWREARCRSWGTEELGSGRACPGHPPHENCLVVHKLLQALAWAAKVKWTITWFPRF